MNYRVGRIDRQVSIRTEPIRVWPLIADLSWFIGTSPAAPAIERVDERLTRVHDEQHGLLHIRLIEARAPSYLAFRFEAPEDPQHVSTLIEFWVDDQRDGTVTLRVRESGFASDGVQASEYQRTLDENGEGWAAALESVRSFLEFA
jgi:uncharacterized protein YndB with AHSA1/START domain